jgi:hypothetical protein
MTGYLTEQEASRLLGVAGDQLVTLPDGPRPIVIRGR